MISEMQVNGREFCVFDKGEGTPLLFAHGFPLDHTMWEHQLNRFSAGYRVIAPDLRGFGKSLPAGDEMTSMESFAEDLVAILDAMSVAEPVVYCGLSMGGYIGWQFFHRFRSRLHAMILCDTKSASDSVEVARGRQLMAQQVISNGVEEAAQNLVTKLFCPTTLSDQPEVVQRTLETMQATDPRSVAAAQRGMASRPDMTHVLPTIDLPTIVICGTDDVITPPDVMQPMADQIPGASFSLVAKAGHMSPLENPESFNSIVDRFLREL